MMSIFKKISMLTLGLAMATGVGWASIGNASSIKAEAEVTTSKLRIWIDRGVNYESASAVSKLHYWDGALIDVEVAPTGYYDNSADSKTYWMAYYDVSSEIVGLQYQIKRYAPDGSTLWNTSATNAFAEGDNNQMWYIQSDGWNGATVTKGVVDLTSVYFVARVLEGYMTCGTGIGNGYEAYPTINSTYIKNGDAWRTVGILSNEILTDYASKDDYGTGKSTGVSTDAWSKLEMMRIQYQAAHPAPGAANIASVIDDKSMIGILMVGVIGLTTIGCFYFLARKKVHA